MNIGNTWVYHLSAFGSLCLCDKYIKFRITGSVIKNSKFYYLFQKTERIINCGVGTGTFFDFLDTNRVDSVTGNILKYSSTGCSYSPNEIMIDSLRAKLHDSIKTCGAFSLRTCLDTSSHVIFGANRSSRGYGVFFVDSGWERGYAKRIGPVGSSSMGQSCNAQMNILGCVIDGVLYGDTTFVVGVNRISSEIPKDYSLYQNYPNPFNPLTKIKFDVPALRDGRDRPLQIKIYDALGKEVTTLVNEQLKPGSYEAEWNASNFPSGVYFYSLVVGDNTNNGKGFIQTKKMVLIK